MRWTIGTWLGTKLQISLAGSCKHINGDGKGYLQNHTKHFLMDSITVHSFFRGLRVILCSYWFEASPKLKLYVYECYQPCLVVLPCTEIRSSMSDILVTEPGSCAFRKQMERNKLYEPQLILYDFTLLKHLKHCFLFLLGGVYRYTSFCT